MMYEFLACTCTINGELHQKLTSETSNDDLFNSSGDIIEAFISGGPVKDISN